MEKFGSAKTLLARLKNAAAPFLGGKPAELADIWIESLLPGGKTPWSQVDDPELLRLYIALASPPGAWFYCGGEAAQLGIGVVNWVNIALPHSVLNLGNAPRVCLVANVRRPAAT
jgi:hypothetical protein